jgi:MFS family permease
MDADLRAHKTSRMAWIVLGAAFTMQMVFSGIHFTFGIFLKPIAEEFEWSRGATAFAYTLLWWVSSPASLLLGMVSDKIGTRKVLLFGALIFGLGIFLTGHIQSLWQFYVFYGVLAGIGRGADRAPLLRSVFEYFNTRKGLAMGITLSGTGVGTLLFPPLGRYIISIADWRVALMVIGLLSWIVLIPAALAIRPPKAGEAEPPSDRSKKGEAEERSGILGSPDKDWTAREVLGNRTFWIFVIAGLACCISHSLPLTHIVAYASDRGIPDIAAAGVLSVIGFMAAIGRLMWGMVADRVGARKTVMCCIMLQTSAMFMVAFMESLWGFYLFAVWFGLSYGGVLPLYAVVTRELFGMNRFGTAYGLHSFATSIGMGGGGIVGGLLFDFSGSYFIPFMTSTVLGIIASAFAIHLAFLKTPGAPRVEKTPPLTVAEAT